MIDRHLKPQPRLVRTGVLSQIGIAPRVAIGVLAVIVISTILAPLIATHGPLVMDPLKRLQGPSSEFLLGTDNYGRDVFSRVLYGGRMSLIIGIAATLISVVVGMLIGLIAGYFRFADALIMRGMDGMMAIPSILLAIALVALSGPSIGSVIAAITIPEIPRVVRLVRAVVLSAREEPYVEAAVALGTPPLRVLFSHLLPNTFSPMIVQGTYILASAILTEAILSFLGAGVSPEIPTWGNIMAEGRTFFRLKPELVLWPGLVLSLCILSVNILGDFARDMLDPRLKKRPG